ESPGNSGKAIAGPSPGARAPRFRAVGYSLNRSCPAQRVALGRSDLAESNPRSGPITFSYRSWSAYVNIPVRALAAARSAKGGEADKLPRAALIDSRSEPTVASTAEGSYPQCAMQLAQRGSLPRP